MTGMDSFGLLYLIHSSMSLLVWNTLREGLGDATWVPDSGPQSLGRCRSTFEPHSAILWGISRHRETTDFDYAEGDDEVRFDDFDGKTIHFLCKLSLEIPKCQHVILPGLFLFVIQHECTRLIYFYSNNCKLFVSFIGFSQREHTHTLEYK